jgi:hypothetical protein
MSASNITLISVDALRFDAISCERDKTYLAEYNLEALPKTPNLDRAAMSGTRFSHAITVSPSTPPSHASLMTGTYPPYHGVRGFLTNSLSETTSTLAETLRSGGYRTVSAIDFLNMFDALGLTRGFELSFCADDVGLFNELKHMIGDKVFLFAHLADPHAPYGQSFCPNTIDYNNLVQMLEVAKSIGIPVSSLQLKNQNMVELQDVYLLEREIRDRCEQLGIADKILLPRYLSGVNKFDQERLALFVRRLKEVGLLTDSSLTIITSDHGEAILPPIHLSSHSGFGHCDSLIEEVIRVPLIFHCPNLIQAGKVIDRPVSIVDVAPTILAYASLEPPVSMQGHSLRDLIELNPSVQIEVSPCYSEVYYQTREQRRNRVEKCLKTKQVDRAAQDRLWQWCIRSQRYKYVEIFGNSIDQQESRSTQPMLALYDLDLDPFEQVDLLSNQVTEQVCATVRSLTEQLRIITSATRNEKSVPIYADDQTLSELLERLEALGYI